MKNELSPLDYEFHLGKNELSTKVNMLKNKYVQTSDILIYIIRENYYFNIETFNLIDDYLVLRILNIVVSLEIERLILFLYYILIKCIIIFTNK